MSLGIGAMAELLLEDEHTVIYSYGGFNWNIPGCENRNYMKDGILIIDKSCFVEPIFQEKKKRMPSGRKRVITKKILVPVDVYAYIDDGRITVENCSHSWHIWPLKNIDFIAIDLIEDILLNYQEEECIPKKIGFFK